MRGFFTYTSPYRTGIYLELSRTEFFVPLFIFIGLLILLIIYKNKFRDNQKLDLLTRRIIGTVFAVVYLSHYVLRFRIYGFDTLILPFQLCGISMFLAIILLFTKNKTIHAFVLYTGVLGGTISLFTPVIGYNSEFYRYYQFYIAHILLILTPIYFMLVHDYYPNKNQVKRAFIILQIIATFMVFFNYFMNTDFMFLFIDPTKITKFPIITKFGGIPYYLIFVELAGIGAFYLMYRLTEYIRKYSKEERVLHTKEV